MSAFLDDADYAWRRPWRRRLFTFFTRMGYRQADAIVATSTGVAEDLVRQFDVPSDRIRVLNNPVDLDLVRRAAAEPLEPHFERRWLRPVIVAAGRLADAKNYPLLIEAMALLRRTIPARLFILGRGEREAALRAQISARRLDDAVELCGFHSNPWKFIARADAFVLTSRYEGFGNVLVEAMACGVPVVATSSPGTRDIVKTSSNGFLVDRHDAHEVAAALARVLGDERLRARLSAAAMASARRFALPVVAASYDRVLGAMLS